VRVYATDVGEEGGYEVDGCTFKATLLLRWWSAPPAEKVLQQAWICQHGHYKWRDIETEHPRTTGART